MNGCDTVNSMGDFGIKAIASANNSPPALANAVQWTDLQGNFWLFGGEDSLEGGSPVSDLWKFDPIINMWTWMGGLPNGQNAGVYGIKGVPSPGNWPGARELCASWTDSSGDLWLFGSAEGYDASGNRNGLCDLWRYNIPTGYWTWMSGPSSGGYAGIYGVLGQPDSANYPPYRGTQANWVDSSNNLWLFGGSGDGVQCYSDMWRYNISTGAWTWMSGPNTVDQAGNYGVLGVESAINLPSARMATATWKDNHGYFYLCGGIKFFSNPCYDLWRYDPNNNYWTWIGGDTTINFTGVYSAQCYFDSSNLPALRYAFMTTQLNNCAQALFTFGGTAFHAYNDLWAFNPQNTEWSWISGSDTNNLSGIYGTKGLPAQTNLPPARSNECFWADKNGHLWVWGGAIPSYTSPKYLNDMWEFIPDPSCIITGYLNYTLSTQNNICPGDSVVLTIAQDSTVNITPTTNVTWLDSFHAVIKPDTTTFYTLTGFAPCGNYDTAIIAIQIVSPPPVTITANKTTLCPGDTAQICAPGGFSSYNWNNGDTTACISTTLADNYYLTVTESGNCSASSNQVNIITYQPSAVTISVNGDTLTGSGSNNYQWLLNGVPIAGATSSVYIAMASGTYAVQATDTHGCTATSSPVVVTGISEPVADNSIIVFPNPSTGNWQLQVPYQLIGSTIEVYDATGRLMFQSVIKDEQSDINIPNLAKGLYQLAIITGGYKAVKKLVKV